MLDLLDYRRRVFALYAQIRLLGTDQAEAFALFRQTRDSLFRDHAQSPLDAAQKTHFRTLNYWDYQPAYRVTALLNTQVEPVEYRLPVGDDGEVTMRQIGQVDFTLPTGRGRLGVFWILGYGGGLFIPFRDASNGQMTYGGGRYLYDTIKGADLGIDGERLILDFNYAYHPSCYYNERWTCPLAPVQNHLRIGVLAGEYLLDKPL